MTREDCILERLRRICLALPEANEVTTWGHPTFRAGKRMFAVFEQYRGEWSIAFKAGLAAQASLLKDHRFYLTPYIGQQGWVSLKVRGRVSWKEIERLVFQSYRLVALKRMLDVIDGRLGRPCPPHLARATLSR